MQGGASLDTRVLCGDGRESTWLCAGSTALHLASARGSVAIALALLEAQASRPGKRVEMPCHPFRRRQPSQHCAALRRGCYSTSAGRSEACARRISAHASTMIVYCSFHV